MENNVSSPRIAVIGAGAIGGITAALMARRGDDVTVVCKYIDTANIAAGRGLNISGHIDGGISKEGINVPVKAVADIAELRGTFDFCLIATKAYDMPQAAKDMLPLLKEDSLVVSMQNGICTDYLSSIVGEDRTVGCSIGFGGTNLSHGNLEMTSTGEFIIGRVGKFSSDTSGEKIMQLKEIMSHVAPCTISSDIYSVLYSKLIVNSCITSLGAICGLKLGEMMKRPDARKIFLSVIGEAVEVAKALEISVPPYGGKLDYFKLMKGTSRFDDLRRNVMIRIVGIKYKDLKSSSLQSLEKGEKTEIDYFNGYIVQKGESRGIDCPVNRLLVKMVKEIENHSREIKVDNLMLAMNAINKMG